MGSDAQWVEATFLPNQRVPDGYEIGGEWGELPDWKVGFGCWYWWHRESGEYGPARRTKFEARRDAIEHARRVVFPPRIT